MAWETKVGLMVGLSFIVLFGVILSSRAGTQGNAELAMGDNLTHQVVAKAMTQDVDPFLRNAAIELPREGATPADAATGVVVAVGPVGGEEPARTTVSETPSSTNHLVFDPERTVTPAEESLCPPETVETDMVASTPATESVAQTYTVAKGDTFIAIAKKIYGQDGERQWRRLWEANKQTVKDPGRLKVGQTIVVPSLPGVDVAKAPAAPAPSVAPAPSAVQETVAQSPAATEAPTESPMRALLSRASRDGIPSVTAEELGRMYGKRSDLTESPVSASLSQMYTVKPGDTFYSIGSKMYGDPKFGRLLYLKNQHLVPDETKLKVGQRILLLDGVEEDHT